LATKKRVFISFDYDHDESVKHLLVGQARNPDSPFDFSDWSSKEHLSGDWKAKIKTKLAFVDVGCVLCGKHMKSANGVDREIEMFQELGIPYFLLEAYSDGGCHKPKAAKPNESLYRWTWPNLKSLVGGGR
jgi:hypothetical protein